MRDNNQVAGMLCPVCKIGLALSDRQGIEIDYCPQCRGVWLDRGELDKILERDAGVSPPRATPAPAAPPPQYQQPPHYDPQYSRYGHKRKKHWLEEIFD